MCDVSAIEVCAIKQEFVQSNKHLCNQTNICAIKHTFVQSNKHLCNQTHICAIKQTFVQSNTHLCNQTNICAIKHTFVQSNKHLCNQTHIKFLQSNKRLCNQTNICAIKQTFVPSNKHLCNRIEMCTIKQTFLQSNKHLLGYYVFLLKNIPKFDFYQWSIGRGVVGFNPLWCLSTPKFVLTPVKIVKILSQKYIADPLWFSHKSSTDFNMYILSFRGLFGTPGSRT